TTRTGVENRRLARYGFQMINRWRAVRARRHLQSSSFFLILFLALPGLCFGQNVEIASLQKPVSIAGKWKFHVGDDLAWSQPNFDDSDWDTLQVPQDWGQQGYKGYSGFAWYRLSLQLCSTDCASDAAKADVLHRLAVTLGKVQSAYELYAGGQLVGTMGGVPPNAKIRYDEFGTFHIPRSAIDEQGSLVLALRVWRTEQAGRAWEGGPFGGSFLVGTREQLANQFFSSQLLVLVLCAVYLVLGCYHCYIYTRHRALTEMLWFGLFAIAVSLYGVMQSQWRFTLPLDFAVLKKIEHSIVFLLAPIVLEFAARLMTVKLWRSVRWYQCSFIALAVIVAVVPGLTINFKLLTLWHVCVLPAIVGVVGLVARHAWLGNPDARKMLVGFLVLAVIALFEIISDLLLVHRPHLVPLGFAVFVLSMPVALGDRITRLVKTLQTRTIELTDLQKNLERSVEERTEELREANQQLERVAHIDLLTQVANRRAFLEHAEGEIAWSQRCGRPFSLIIADIDHFKMFNDEFGHACGDFVLSEIAATLVKNVRATDMFARWGGEEFVFTLRETDAAGAVDLAEKCRRLIEQQRYAYGGMELGVTMTFGVSEYQSWMTIEHCMEEADDALYHGKAAGRNTVACSKTSQQHNRADSVIANAEIP
ncbi:MAG: diguanylate cyclase, partial [Pseudomonadales bacterium]